MTISEGVINSHSICEPFSLMVCSQPLTISLSVGNELTPSAKYDFKFKDYSPWVFRYMREEIFGLDPADYLLSLTAKYILSELGSPGKSGSFFYFSRDYRFIIKTIRHSEHKFLLSILKDYYQYVRDNPHTLLSRFYGLHRVKLPRGKKIHFVIMNNLFPPHKDVHETYDLKGSTVGRLYPEEKAAINPRAVLKDLNWIDRRKILELGPEKRALLTEQLRRDAEFLKRIDVMDYSLLVGIHNMQRGNRDNVRKNTLKVFSVSTCPTFLLFKPDLSSSLIFHLAVRNITLRHTTQQAQNQPKPSQCVVLCDLQIHIATLSIYPKSHHQTRWEALFFIKMKRVYALQTKPTSLWKLYIIWVSLIS